MTNVYQIYKKHAGENTFVEAGLINRFWNEEEAIARCKVLNDTWRKFGYEYIVVKVK